MDAEQINRIKKERWCKQLKAEYEHAPMDFLELMVDCYLNNPEQCEKIIQKHKDDEIKIL